MVGLSELNINLFDKLANYINRHDYKEGKIESQYSNDKSLQTEEAPERIVKKLVQKQKILSDREISEIVSGYKSGLNIYQLAKQFGCHRTTISQHLKAQDIKMRNRPMTESQIDEAVKLYKSGLSCVKIGNIIGVDDTTIYRRLLERGVRVRGPHERLNF